MTNKYEQRYLVELAFRAAHRFPARSVVARELSNCDEDLDLAFDWDLEVDSFKRKGVGAAIWTGLRRRLVDRFASAVRRKLYVLTQNITFLIDHLKLA